MDAGNLEVKKTVPYDAVFLNAYLFLFTEKLSILSH